LNNQTGTPDQSGATPKNESDQMKASEKMLKQYINLMTSTTTTN